MKAQINLGLIAIALISLLIGGIVGYYAKPVPKPNCPGNTQTIDSDKVREVVGAIADYIEAVSHQRPAFSVKNSYYENGIIVVDVEEKTRNTPLKIYLTPNYAFIGFNPPLELSQLKEMVKNVKKAQEERAKRRYNVSTTDDPYEGEENAPVVVVEFFDFQCPGCRGFYKMYHQDIKERYIDTGKIKLIYRDFPLSGHAYARKAALAADCALEQGMDKYFEYMDKLFTGNLDDGSLKQYAQEIGLDMDKFNQCLESEKYSSEVSEDYQAALDAEAPGTPTFYVNGRMVEGQLLSEIRDNLYALIEEELAKANAGNSS